MVCFCSGARWLAADEVGLSLILFVLVEGGFWSIVGSSGGHGFLNGLKSFRMRGFGQSWIGGPVIYTFRLPCSDIPNS
jgi:hypothetical protein